MDALLEEAHSTLDIILLEYGGRITISLQEWKCGLMGSIRLLILSVNNLDNIWIIWMQSDSILPPPLLSGYSLSELALTRASTKMGKWDVLKWTTGITENVWPGEPLMLLPNIILGMLSDHLYHLTNPVPNWLHSNWVCLLLKMLIIYAVTQPFIDIWPKHSQVGGGSHNP
jgi:hypothetical protein